MGMESFGNLLSDIVYLLPLDLEVVKLLHNEIFAFQEYFLHAQKVHSIITDVNLYSFSHDVGDTSGRDLLALGLLLVLFPVCLHQGFDFTLHVVELTQFEVVLGYLFLAVHVGSVLFRS